MKKIIAIILCITLMIGETPIVSAQEIVNDDTQTIADTVAENEVSNQCIIGELTEKRSENEKHFLMSDRTIMAAVYDTPVHYKKNGKWDNIDNSLSEKKDSESKEKVLENKNNSFKVKFAKKFNKNNLVSINKDGYKMKWSLENAKKVSAEIVTNNCVEENSNLSALKNISGTVLYDNILPNVNLRYTVFGSSLKEDIVLTNENVQQSFTFVYESKALSARINEEGQIEVYDKKDESKNVFFLDAPYMLDAEYACSENIKLDIENTAKGFKLTVTPDREWLESDERVYPVTVDPMLTTQQSLNGVATKYYTQNQCDQMANGTLYVGNEKGQKGVTSSTLKFELPNIGMQSRIIMAELNLFQYGYSHVSSPSLCINAYEVNEWWSSSPSWPGTTEAVPAHSNIIEDYAIVGTNTTNTWVDWDITETVNKWYDGTLSNQGILLTSADQNAWAITRFTSQQLTYAPQATPILIIQYCNISGIEDYWTYTSVPTKNGGGVSVNNFSGNLVASFPICGIDNGILPVNISLIYNSTLYQSNEFGIGSGLQTNYNMKIVSSVNESETISYSQYPFFLIDSDGTKHYFQRQSGNSAANEWKDEDGLGYTLVQNDNGSDYRWMITDKKKNKLKFDWNGDLTCIEDEFSNKIIIELRNRRIIKIKDSMLREYLFTYEGDRIRTIVDPYNRVTSFAGCEGYQSFLHKITYPDNTIEQIYYNSGFLGDIESPGEASIHMNIAQNSARRYVKSIEQFSLALGYGTGIRYTFAYNTNSTKIVDSTGNINVTYQFDTFGRTIGVINNITGQASYNTYFSNTGADSRNNKPETASKAISANNNYVFDGGFNKSTDMYSFIEDNDSSGFRYYDNSMGNLFNGSIKVVKNSENSLEYTNSQNISLLAGTYTLSAYICTNGETLSNGGKARLYVEGADITVDKESEIVNETDSGEWKRISTCVTLLSDQQVTVKFGLSDTAIGTIWFDDICMEYGNTPNHVNLLKNSSVIYDSQGWSGSNYQHAFVKPNYVSNKGYSLMIPGSSNVESKIVQEIHVSGNKDDVFCFGGWVCANSTQTRNAKSGTNRKSTFRIVARFYDSNGNIVGSDTNKNVLDANTQINDWQFVASELIAPKSYAKISFSFEYDYNTGNAFIADPFLYKEKYGQTYTYDSNGNIVSSSGLADSESQMTYMNNQLKSIINTSGTKVYCAYGLDESTRLDYVVSTDGKATNIDYDSKGNVLHTIIQGRKFADEIKVGKTYIFLNAESGNCLSISDDKLVTPVCSLRYFQIAGLMWTVANIDGTNFRLKSGVKSGNIDLYLSVYSGTNVEDENLVTCQAIDYRDGFEFFKNDDGTFAIKTYISGKTRCIDGTPNGTKGENYGSIKHKTYNKNDKGQKWYAIEMGSCDVITTNYTYDDTKNLQTTATDSLGNTTSYLYTNDSRKLLDSVVDANGNKVNYSYDINDNIEKVEAKEKINDTDYATKATVSYDYNQNGSLKSINSPSNTTYNFLYDELNRLTETKVNNTLLSKRVYVDTDDSHLKQLIYGNGAVKNYTYNVNGQVIKSMWDETVAVENVYNKDGNLYSTFDYLSGRKNVFDYDLANRLTFTQLLTGDTELAAVSYKYENKKDRLSEYTVNIPAIAKKIKTKYGYGNIASGQIQDTIYQVDSDNIKIVYNYDALERRTSKEFVTPTGNTLFTTRYSYKNSSKTTATSNVIDSVTNNTDQLSYTYNNVGNITEIKKNGTVIESYTYDGLNQLHSATYGEHTYIYTYDDGGNILSVNKDGTTVKSFSYDNAEWKDLLTSFNGSTITYDQIGNPLTYRSGFNFTWANGRQLMGITKDMDNISYLYDADGIRTQKTVNGVITDFYWINGTLQAQKTGDEYIIFLYDENGSAYGMILKNNTTEVYYYYIYNLQGDVIGIVDDTGTQVVAYEYGAWGDITAITGTLASTIGEKSPIRYRGYYYDVETGFYYVSSRYYDPEIGRWINADNQIAGVGGEILGYNMFAYCMNNPVNMEDPTGNWPKWVKKAVAAVAVVAVIAVVAAVTVATAGAGTAIAAVAVGAAKGAAIGFAVGAATGAVGGAISHRISTGSWDGAGEAALNGMANGALSGAVSGAITGGITGGISYNSGATSAGTGFDTYRQLKSEIGSPGAGNEWHHIVEQSQIAKSGFSPQMIQNTNNIMSISKTTHRAISGYYSSVQPFTNGMIVRNWLAGQSFSAQYEFGINVIKMFM